MITENIFWHYIIADDYFRVCLLNLFMVATDQYINPGEIKSLRTCLEVYPSYPLPSPYYLDTALSKITIKLTKSNVFLLWTELCSPQSGRWGPKPLHDSIERWGLDGGTLCCDQCAHRTGTTVRAPALGGYGRRQLSAARKTALTRTWATSTFDLQTPFWQFCST